MCSFDDKKGIFNSCWQISSVRLKISAEKTREKEIERGEGERERKRGSGWKRFQDSRPMSSMDLDEFQVKFI